MRTGYTYTERYRVELASDDGFVYALAIDQASASGGPVEPLMLTALSIRGTTEGGGEGVSSDLSPLAPSTLTATVLGAATGFGALAGGVDGEWRARLLRDVDEDGEAEALVWLGYLTPSPLRESPDDPNGAVTLAFSEGLGQIAARPALPPEAPADTVRTAIDALVRVLYPLGAATEEAGVYTLGEDAWAGVVTAVDWRAKVPDDAPQVSAAADPLAVIYVPDAAFRSQSGAVEGQRSALLTLAARFGARLFQSHTDEDGAGWWFVQREALARAAYGHTEGVPATVWPRTSLSLARGVLQPFRDCTRAAGWRYLRDPARVWGLPIREVQATYGYEPPEYDLVLGSSFENPGGADGQPGGSGAQYWALYTPVEDPGDTPHRVDMSAPDYYGVDFDVTDSDKYALLLYGNHPTRPPDTATQAGWVTVPGSADWRFAFTAQAIRYVNAAYDPQGFGRVALSLEDANGRTFGLASYQLTLRGRALKGRRVTLYTTRLLSDVDGAVEGVPVLPAGLTLYVYRRPAGSGSPQFYARVTLTRPAKVGDSVIEADVEPFVTGEDYETLEAGDWIEVYYWADAPEWLEGSQEVVGTGVGTVEYGVQISAGGVAPDGVPASGTARVVLSGPPTDGDPDNPLFETRRLSFRQLWDEVSWAVTGGDERTGRLTYSAALLPSDAGFTATLPIGADESPIGDGPTPASTTRLRIAGSNGTVHDTIRGNGERTAWKRGAWAPGETPARSVTIDDLLVDGAMRMLAASPANGAAPEVWEGTLVLRGRQALAPHEVPILDQSARLLKPVSAGAGAAFVSARSAVGYGLWLEPGTPREEAFRVLSVTQGAGGVYVTLGDPETGDPAVTARAHEGGTLARYAFPAWWGAYEWDVVTGRLGLLATRLDWDASDPPLWTRDIRLGD